MPRENFPTPHAGGKIAVMKSGTLTWAEVCAIPWLKDIPAKIETNKHNKIMVSPRAVWQGVTQCGIGLALDQRLKDGRCLISCPIDTTDGTRVADVAWISKERFKPHRRAVSLRVALSCQASGEPRRITRTASDHLRVQGALRQRLQVGSLGFTYPS